MNISFVLAVYNRLELTKECYKNVRDLYPDAPFVISSGGSSDGTREWLESLEDDSKQRTVLSTGRLSYDGVKFYLSYRANDFFKNYDKADIKILSAKDLDKDSSIKTKSFDVIFSIDGEIIALEIKVTQSNSSFTGATHSTKKVNDYLLISLLVDRDTIVEETKQYVKGVFAMMVNLQQNEWNGKAKKNSSWTSLKFKSNKNYDDN